MGTNAKNNSFISCCDSHRPKCIIVSHFFISWWKSDSHDWGFSIWTSAFTQSFSHLSLSEKCCTSLYTYAALPPCFTQLRQFCKCINYSKCKNTTCLNKGYRLCLVVYFSNVIIQLWELQQEKKKKINNLKITEEHTKIYKKYPLWNKIEGVSNKKAPYSFFSSKPVLKNLFRSKLKYEKNKRFYINIPVKVLILFFSTEGKWVLQWLQLVQTESLTV